MRSGKVSILATITVGSERCVNGAQSPELALGIPRIVFGVYVFEAEWSNRRYLRDVFAGFCPVEVPGIAGEHDNTAGRICLDPVAVELIAEPDVEHTRHDRIDSILRMPMRHQFHPRGHLDPDQVRSGLSRLSHKHGQSGRRWERRKRLPVDLFRQNRFENSFAWLMCLSHCDPPVLRDRSRLNLRSTWHPM